MWSSTGEYVTVKVQLDFLPMLEVIPCVVAMVGVILVHGDLKRCFINLRKRERPSSVVGFEKEYTIITFSNSTAHFYTTSTHIENMIAGSMS